MPMILPPDQLLERAARLRQHADEVADALAHVRPFHRPDVWRGRRAVRFTVELAEQHRRLLGAVGVVSQLLDLADRLERQATWATLTSPSPSPFTALSSGLASNGLPTTLTPNGSSPFPPGLDISG